MKIVEILNILAYCNIIISLGPAALTILTILVLKLPFNFLAPLLAFLISFFVYSFNRLTDIREDIINNPDRTLFFKKKMYIFVIAAFISLFLCLALALLHSLLTFIILLLPAILVILYSFEWMRFASKKRLKELLLIKNITVSLGWSLIPFFVMAFYNYFHWGIIFLSCFIFLRIFIGVLMFDIRDIEGDKKHNITTIPIKYGLKFSKRIIEFLNIISFLILLIGCIYLFWAPLIISAFVGLFFGFIYQHYIQKIDMRFLCNVIVDSEYIFLGLIPLLLWFKL